MKTLEISVDIIPLPLTPMQMRTITQCERYDFIVYTSKHAQEIFELILKKQRIRVPKRKIIRVGPRQDLLKIDLKGKRVLFPRSALAPFDIIRKLRDRDVSVTPLAIYTAQGKALSTRERKDLFSGQVDELYFKSPSGIDGLLGQIPRTLHRTIKTIPALCIGKTTAHAAREKGWKKVSIKKVV